MKVAKREQMIISLLESRGEISVNELSSILNVSVSTLRKQLAVMQENGMVIRTYGGVMSVNRVPDESFDSKMQKNITEKRRIAEKARSLVPNGSVVALGSGTSVFCLANLLDDMNKGVIYTNSMQAADLLSRCAGLEVHISGGIIRSRTGTVIGNEAGDCFNNIKNVDYAFIGCDAIDVNGDVYSDNLSVATVEKRILMSAKYKFILCDPAKIGRTSVAQIINLKSCDGLITINNGNHSIDNYNMFTKVIEA